MLDTKEVESSFPTLKKSEEEAKTADRKYGFDLTDISAANWIKILKESGISKIPKLKNSAWVWQGRGILIYTSSVKIKS